MSSTFKIVYLFAFIFYSLFGCKNAIEFSTKKSQPNVIIILADDLGYGDISSYGQKNHLTPHIDHLASLGVICTDFYVPTPYCAPSRATLLTGRFPLRHGLVRNPTPDAGIDDIGILPDEITLGEVFQEAGYKTSCIGKWHLGHREEYFPVNHGFDEYYGILYSNDMRPVQIVENRDTVEYPVDQTLLTKKYTDRAIDFINRNMNKPFFLHLCHAMPHKPLAASERFYTPETPNDLYANVIKELDWSVGEIMNTLNRLSLLENTIVVFMSDNGPWYGGNTGGLKGMKATTWEGGIRVPFMISYAGVLPDNNKIEVPCASADLYPTLLSLVGINMPQNYEIDGQNITEILKGNQVDHEPIFSMHNDHISTVRNGDWKLFVREPRYYKEIDLNTWFDKRGPDGMTIIAPIEGQATPAQYPGVIPLKPENEIQLFNMKNDPEESADLAKEHPELVEELWQIYKDYEGSFIPINIE